MNTNVDKDHDAEVEGKATSSDGKTRSVMLVKVGPEHPRPHADGCVGCRRDHTCTKCGRGLDRTKDRTRDLCSSGACTSCCARTHFHADSNPYAVASVR